MLLVFIRSKNIYFNKCLGPTRFPLVGNYLEVRKLRNELGFYHLVWNQLAKCYGQVFSVKLGRIEAVVVSGYDAVRQVLCKDDFDGRPDGFFFRFRAFYKRLGKSRDARWSSILINNIRYLL